MVHATTVRACPSDQALEMRLGAIIRPFVGRIAALRGLHSSFSASTGMIGVANVSGPGCDARHRLTVPSPQGTIDHPSRHGKPFPRLDRVQGRLRTAAPNRLLGRGHHLLCPTWMGFSVSAGDPRCRQACGIVVLGSWRNHAAAELVVDSLGWRLPVESPPRRCESALGSWQPIHHLSFGQRLHDAG